MRPPWRMDLHVHGRRSPDCRVPYERYARRAAEAGIHGFALTDHNEPVPEVELRELQRAYPQILLLPGVEVSAKEGHVLVLGTTERAPRRPPLAELLDWARSRDAVPALAHPFRWVHGVGRAVAADARVEAVESVNGRTAEAANARAELLAVRRRLAPIGGSDAHELRSLGRAFTELADAPGSVDEAVALIRRGRTVAGGRSLAAGGRLRLTVWNGLLRARRGFRPV